MTHFLARQLCSQSGCTGKGEIEPDYPGATIKTFAQAPPRCSHCGGPWRLVETGYSCLICGRGIIVSAALLALASGTGVSRL